MLAGHSLGVSSWLLGYKAAESHLDLKYKFHDQLCVMDGLLIGIPSWKGESLRRNVESCVCVGGGGGGGGGGGSTLLISCFGDLRC